MSGSFRKFTIVILIALTLALAGASVYIGYKLSQEDVDDTPVASGNWEILMATPGCSGGVCECTHHAGCELYWFDCPNGLTNGRCLQNEHYAGHLPNGASKSYNEILGNHQCSYVQIDMNYPGSPNNQGDLGAITLRWSDFSSCESGEPGEPGEPGDPEDPEDPDDGGGNEYPINFEGRVYCQEGEEIYPMRDVLVMVRNDDPVAGERTRLSTRTGSQGRYSIEFDQIRWGGHFDVLIRDINETLTLSNGTPYSQLILDNTYCDYPENDENLMCVNIEEAGDEETKGYMSCSTTDETYQDADRITDFGYEFYDHCRLKRADNDMWNGNPTAGNFDFVFRNCSGVVPPQDACGDGICQSGESCENPGSVDAIVCPGGESLDATCRQDCTYCGDGVVDVAAGEECDHGGTPTVTCDANCQTIEQEDINQCIDLERNETDPVGPNEVEIFNVEVTTTGSDQPYALQDVRLRVSLTTNDTAVGQDIYDPGEAIVTAFSVAPEDGVWRYYFGWEADSLTNGNYEVEVSFDGGVTWDDTAACIYDFEYSAEEAVDPAFLIIKEGTSVCTVSSGASLTYTITVTNLGPGSGVIAQIEDTIDPVIEDAWVTNITSSTGVAGTISNGVIRWIGTETQRTFAEGEEQTYRYTVIVPAANVGVLANGVENTAVVEVVDDQIRYTYFLDDICDIPVSGDLPATGIIDNTPWIFALSALLFGMVAYKLGGGSHYVQPLLQKIRFSALTTVGLANVEADTRKKEMEEGFNDV